ncbi:hypothetical protein NHX12_022867, partial [Muraenolepis orangiensis]
MGRSTAVARRWRRRRGPWLSLVLALLPCLACTVSGYPFRTPLEADTTPRLTIPTAGLEGCRRFRSPWVVDYGPLLVDEASGRLWVGARGAAFSLNASDISAGAPLAVEWEASQEKKEQCLAKGKDNKTECFNHIRFLQRFNSTHLYICGTYAFSPLCAYIEEERFVMSSQPEEGKDKCPYGPAVGYTALIVEQQMYSASRYEFRSFPDLRLNGPPLTLKTEDAPTRWLNDADFVGSALVEETRGGGDDDKLFFFFTEASEEQAAGNTHGRVARVARVCKKRWTSFLKARLVCSLPEFHFHFNVLRSVFLLRGSAPGTPSSTGVRPGVGPYMENSPDSGSQWSQYTGKVPQPRPGTCITDELRARDIRLSTSLPDDVLDFVRRHPLMAIEVQPLDGRPLVFRRTTDYTHMAVDVVTDDGWLHRAVSVDGQLHIIEELQLFDDPQPVNSLVISPAQLPLSTCQRYSSCYDCLFARDPYCGWNSSQCVPILSHTDRSAIIQDIQQGNRGCENNSRDGDDPPQTPAARRRAVAEGDDALLRCELTSNLATPLWTRDGAKLSAYGLDSGFRAGTDGLLILAARPDQRGLYTCYGVENGVRVPMVSYNVTPGAGEEPGATPPARMALLSRRNTEAMYLSLITVLGGLCVVLTVVLLYLELKTVSGRYDGNAERHHEGGEGEGCGAEAGLLQI